MRIDLAPDGGRHLHRRARLRLHVRAAPPPGDALRRPGAQGARRAHDLQLPRAADEPGGRAAPGHRRLGSGLPGGHRRRPGAARRRPRVGRILARRARRDEHLGPHHRRRSRRRRPEHLHREPGGLRADDERRSAGHARRLARGERRRRRGRSSPARPARAATSPCSTRAPRSTPPAAPTTSPRASRPPRPRSTTAPPCARSTRSSRARSSSPEEAATA